MTAPTSQHLYVMQNEFGCIKVGRSVDPWERRRNLCQSEHCKIELVAAFEGGGEDEEAIHIELDEYRLEGEWFDGAGETRAAVERIFRLDPSEWKFDHDPDGATKWLGHLRGVRKAHAVRRFVATTISALRVPAEPDWDMDVHIFWCLCLIQMGDGASMDDRPFISVKNWRGKTAGTWYNPESKRQEAVPAYTKSIDAALLAWPDDLRPNKWKGSPRECCLAALTELRARLPKVARR